VMIKVCLLRQLPKAGITVLIGTRDADKPAAQGSKDLSHPAQSRLLSFHRSLPTRQSTRHCWKMMMGSSRVTYQWVGFCPTDG
jgi:hypothetical protein